VTQLLHPGSELHLEAGALRVGVMLGWQVVALRVLAVGLIGLAWVRARDVPVDPRGAPALASIAVLLILSPVFSPQYVLWLIPWAAIVAAERSSRDVRILTVGASAFAALAFAVYWGSRSVWELGALTTGKLVCVAGLALVGFTHANIDRNHPLAS
jgi:hypothetical protein